MFNSEAFISETIESVLNQTYTHWELILIDDASNDATVQMAQTYSASNTKIKLLINDSNLGAAASRNRGIEASQGEFIAFLDADDLWKPHKLHTQIHFMLQSNSLVSFSSYELIDEKGYPKFKLIKALPILNYHRLLKCNYIGNLTGVYNASVLGKITTYNLRKRQDWLLWLNAVKASGKPAKGIQESLAYYRVRANSMSSKKFYLLKYNYRVYKQGLGFSTLKSLWFMVLFLTEYFLVKPKYTVSINTI